jgi:glycosyltransferase involved in cell wall biosynthesis
MEIKRNKPDVILITANPFNQFLFGYLLKKQFNIPWIADYRDDWTTSELKVFSSLIDKFIMSMQRRYEKKWVGTASYISSVSPYYVEKISNLTKISGFVLQNGFNPNLQKMSTPVAFDGTFRILHNGTLYNTQRFEIFIEAMKMVIDNIGDRVNIELLFPGVAIDPHQVARIKTASGEYFKYFKISNRIPQEELMYMQQKANMVLMVAHSGLKGIPSSKLYEYIALRKRILVCPSDGDIIEQIVSDCEVGFIANEAAETAEIILQEIETCIKTQVTQLAGNPEKIEKYSSNYQVNLLAEKIDSLIHT